MARKYLTAGLLLVLTLSLTACGTSDKAGTSAHRWDGGTNAASQDWAIQRQADARGPLSGSTDGSSRRQPGPGRRLPRPLLRRQARPGEIQSGQGR